MERNDGAARVSFAYCSWEIAEGLLKNHFGSRQQQAKAEVFYCARYHLPPQKPEATSSCLGEVRIIMRGQGLLQNTLIPCLNRSFNAFWRLNSQFLSSTWTSDNCIREPLLPTNLTALWQIEATSKRSNMPSIWDYQVQCKFPTGPSLNS